MEKIKYSSGSIFEMEMAFSRAVRSGEWIYVSGCTGYNYETGVISDSIEDQTEQTFLNIENALKEVGADWNHVVKINYYIPDQNDFPKTWPIIRKYLSEHLPACTAIACPLVNDKLKIEIDVIAHVA